MFLLIAASLTFAATPVASPKELDIGISQRWALVSGLKNQLRGNYVIIGLKGAQDVCDTQKVCTTPAALKTDPRSVSMAANALKIDGDPAVAIASVLTAWRGAETFNVLLSVYDTKTGIVSRRRAEIGYRNGDIATQQLRRLVTVNAGR